LITLDTSVLVGSLAGDRISFPALLRVYGQGERLLLPTIVLYEWLRGPRLPVELADQETLLPSDMAEPFSARDAEIAAQLYRQISRPRGREMDLAIAACAIAREIPLWTLNRKDFADIPGLQLSLVR
jgi:predicted nucleic acid-binding protein